MKWLAFPTSKYVCVWFLLVFNIRNYYLISHQLCFLFFFLIFCFASSSFRTVHPFLIVLFCIYICIYKFVCSNIYIYISIYYIEIYSLIRSSRKTCIHLLLVYARVIDCWLLKIDFRLDICNVDRDIHTYTTYIIQNLYLIRLILFLSSYFFRLLLFRFSFCFVLFLFVFLCGFKNG